MNCKQYDNNVLQKVINVVINNHHYHFLYSSHMAIIPLYMLCITALPRVV